MSQAKSTTTLLAQLRALMKDARYVKEPLHAYIVPSCDAHNSEYLAACDERRPYISGFNGSLGTAIITDDKACMWTDGRYYLQASQQMDSNWTLMKEGLPGTPTRGSWLSKYLPPGSSVGVDPKLITYSDWSSLKKQLATVDQKLVSIPINLIDLIWPDRPARPKNAIKPLSVDYTGRTISNKLRAIQMDMKERNAEFLVVTALDDIAWLLNLRGSDIDYNPLFFSYVIVGMDKLYLFVDKDRITPDVQKHLESEAEISVVIEPYENVESKLKELSGKLSGSYVWLSDTANYALISSIPEKSLIAETIPIPLMKSIKNNTEKLGLRNAHIRDAAALCCFFSWLEAHIKTETITEISAATKLEHFRSLQANYIGLSFPTISSVGPHGAIIHYKPDKNSDVPLTTDSLYLCDSGGQYLDGTTDVTRTLHFGTPSQHEKECFTRVLKGQLQMAKLVFPSKIQGDHLDSFARKFLWDVGLDYGHGTGHGIGSYLCVHEQPILISWRYKADDPGIQAGMFVSNEPGYYEDGKFGIRIEDIVEVVPANTRFNFNERGFLTFETITLVPKQRKMIVVEMLTDDEVEFLNAYHKKCREVVGEVLEKQGQSEAKEWLYRETEPIKK